MINRDDEPFSLVWSDSLIKKNSVRRAWVVLATHGALRLSETPASKETNHA
jgi:hypothetical protein